MSTTRMAGAPRPHPASPPELAPRTARYRAVRQHSETLCGPLAADDYGIRTNAGARDA